MAIIFLASTSGAPGVTTASVALAMSWAKPVILVEADTSKTSSIIPGALRGQVYHNTGLTEAAVADLHGALTPDKIWEQTVELDKDKVLIPGFKSLAGAAGADARFWRALIDALRPYEATGYDLIIDAGRLQVHDPRIPLLREADSVTLVADATLPSIASILPHWQTTGQDRRPIPEWLKTELSEIGHAGYVDLVVVDRQTAQMVWPAHEIAKLTGLNLVGTIPWDPKGAAVYALGASAVSNRNPYARAIGAILHTYGDVLNARAFKPVNEWEEQR